MEEYMDPSNSQAMDMTAMAVNEGDALLEQLIGLVAGSEASAEERRVRDRYPICCKMQIVPIDRCGRPLAQETLTVFGKDLSRRGICFSHELPLASKRFNVSFIINENS